MTELKTLKDIEYNGCWEEPEEVDKKDIKQEAIKWYHRSDDNKHKFIREFFNITEEDLNGNNKN